MRTRRPASLLETGASEQERAAESRPLAELLVIDLSRALAGPQAAMMLGDLGARVIKVETPGRGDDSRSWGPPFVTPNGAATESTYFLSANRNKESVTLDLTQPDDAEVLRRLLVRADVLVENFRPGALERLGFAMSDLARLNPRLVVLSVSGFGHDGPEGGRPGYDQIAQGETGLMSLTGCGPDDPQRVGVPIADLLAGIYGAYGVLAALLDRHQTGCGQVVRTSLLAAVVASHALHGTAWTVAGQVGHAQGNHHPAIAPYGLFRCKDTAVQIACGNEALWQRFCAVFDLDPDRPEFATNTTRVQHRDELIAAIEERLAVVPSATVIERLTAADVPAGRVRTIDEVYDWEQTQSQHLVVPVHHATLGDIEIPGSALRFFNLEGRERTRRQYNAPPPLGHHTTSIRDWLAGGQSA